MNVSALASLDSLRAQSTAQSAITIAAAQPITELLAQTNSLSIAQVNAILIALDGNGLNNGTVNLSGQTPPAPPTGLGETAASNLIAKLWTVTVDPLVAWAPATETVTWIDGNGAFVGNLATFNSTADYATVSSMVFGATGNLTSLTHLQSLPALAILDCNTESLTTLNVTNCLALINLNCSFNSLATLDVSTCTALLSLDCHSNSLTGLDVSSCTMLDFLDCSSNLIGSVGPTNIVGLNNTSLTYVDCNNNAGIETVDISSITGISTLNCYSCGLTAAGLTLPAATTAGGGASIDASGNGGLTTVNLNGIYMFSLSFANCSLTTASGGSYGADFANADFSNNSLNQASVDSLLAAMALSFSVGAGTISFTGVLNSPPTDCTNTAICCGNGFTVNVEGPCSC